MINFKFLFKLDLVDINSIDFYFSDTFEKLETEPILTKNYPTDGRVSHGAIEMSVDNAEIELLPDLFYAEAVIHLNDGTSIKAHARTLKHQEALLTTILNDGDEEIDVKFHVDETDVKYIPGNGIEIEDNEIGVKLETSLKGNLLRFYENGEDTGEYQLSLRDTDLGANHAVRQALSNGGNDALVNKEYANNLTNDALKNKIEVNITVENGIKTDAISCHDISIIRYKNKDLISNESLYLIPIINNEEQEYIDITEKAYNDVINYDSVKFLVESNKTRHFTLIKENDVIRNRQYFKEVEVLTNSKVRDLFSARNTQGTSNPPTTYSGTPVYEKGTIYVKYNGTYADNLKDWTYYYLYDVGNGNYYWVQLTNYNYLTYNYFNKTQLIEDVFSDYEKQIQYLKIDRLPAKGIPGNTISWSDSQYSDEIDVSGMTTINLTSIVVPPYTVPDSIKVYFTYNGETDSVSYDLRNEIFDFKSNYVFNIGLNNTFKNTDTIKFEIPDETSGSVEYEAIYDSIQWQQKIDSTHKLSADLIAYGSNYMVIPKPTAADTGKVLQVNSNGQPEWVTL